MFALGMFALFLGMSLLAPQTPKGKQYNPVLALVRVIRKLAILISFLVVNQWLQSITKYPN